MSIETLPSRTVPADVLGGPGRADPTQCSSLAIRALGEAAGPGFAVSSISLDMAAGKVSAECELRLRVDKRTRAVAFTTLEAWCGDQLVFTARGLFTRAE